MYRKFDNKLKSNVMTIFAGEYYISSKKEIISTVLGSCISVCLYDRENGIGGMNHFMLPGGSNTKKIVYRGDSGLRREELTEDSMRYGITAMEVLIAEMQKKGAKRINLKAKIFGGGNVLAGKSRIASVGDKNIGFAKAYLKSEGIPIESENIGQSFGRKIFFLTGRNSVFVKRVALEPAVEEERHYMNELMKLKQKSEITIF